MDLFISYAHKNNQSVSKLAAICSRLRHDVNYDQELSGGDVWWAQILTWIEKCHVFIFALSPESLASEPCQAELAYAQALNKPILPLMVKAVDTDNLPPVLRDIQYEDMRRMFQRWRGCALCECVAGALTEIDTKIDAGLFPSIDPPPERPPFPYPEKKSEVTERSPARTLAHVLEHSVARLSVPVQWWLFLVAYVILFAIGQGLLWSVGGISTTVYNPEPPDIFVIGIGLFALLGFLRGWTRAFITSAGIVLGMFLIHLFESPILAPLVGDDPTALFYISAFLLLSITFFALQTPPVLAPRQYRGRDRVFIPGRGDFQEGVLGALVGAWNGYLVAGSLWYYLEKYEYPLSFLHAPTGSAAEWVNILPQVWLLAGNGNVFALITLLLVVFVIVVI